MQLPSAVALALHYSEILLASSGNRDESLKKLCQFVGKKLEHVTGLGEVAVYTKSDSGQARLIATSVNPAPGSDAREFIVRALESGEISTIGSDCAVGFVRQTGEAQLPMAILVLRANWEKAGVDGRDYADKAARILRGSFLSSD